MPQLSIRQPARLRESVLGRVEAASEEIVRHPLMWRRVKERFRRYLTQQFHYGLIYVVQGDTIYVAAIMHLKRKPGYWTARTRKPSS